MDWIKEGYCIIVNNFYAHVVPFKTELVSCSVDEVPTYSVIIPNGERHTFNELELYESKEDAENDCKRTNKRMEEHRKVWVEHGIFALDRLKLMSDGMN